MANALLMVDIQRDYFSGGRMEVEGALKAAEGAKQLLEHFRRRGEMVIHIRHLSTRPGATFFLPGTEGTEIHESVLPLPGEPELEKNLPNSFVGTGLDAMLKAGGADRLVICGMMTHMCIDTTVRAAFDLGYQVLLPHDATATRALAFGDMKIPAAQVQGAFMSALGAVFARVLDVEEVIKLLKD